MPRVRLGYGCCLMLRCPPARRMGRLMQAPHLGLPKCMGESKQETTTDFIHRNALPLPCRNFDSFPLCVCTRTFVLFVLSPPFDSYLPLLPIRIRIPTPGRLTLRQARLRRLQHLGQARGAQQPRPLYPTTSTSSSSRRISIEDRGPAAAATGAHRHLQQRWKATAACLLLR